MTRIDHLIEQHIRESESRLRHVDEMMHRAKAAEQAVPAEVAARLAQIKQRRDQVAQQLVEFRARPAGDAAVAKQSEGLKGMLETMGLELEKALTAIFGQGG